MKKKTMYLTPNVEVMICKVECGFAGSNPSPSFTSDPDQLEPVGDGGNTNGLFN